jgi:peptidoglycan/LPS O-acetylase OafA/YrhL
VRGLAILLVVVGHVGGFGFIPSGAGVGVILFFVLSGYLITGLLLSEWARAATIDLGAFYKRRVRRLLPALVPFLLAFAVYEVTHGSRVVAVVEAALGVLFFSANVSGGWGWHIPELLGHTWSLAVEEQFYLVWPASLLVLLRTGMSRRKLLWLAVAGALGVAAARAALCLAGANQDQLYVTLRADSLLAGCAIAFADLRLPRWALRMGIAALVVMSHVIWPSTAATTLGYSLMTAACVLVVAGARSENILANRALARAGIVSYGWYLWHVPLWKLVDNRAVVVVGSYALAEASYRLLESRFLRRPREGTEPAL